MLPTAAKCFLVFALPALLGGCANSSRNFIITIRDGCEVTIKASTMEQAKEIVKHFRIDENCEVTTGSGLSGS